LKEALETIDITIYTHTQGKRVLFDGTKTATGVLVLSRGFKYTISANKEVVVSAGVFYSPQLLLVLGKVPHSNDSKTLLI
jgi:choline dehydrogenase